MQHNVVRKEKSNFVLHWSIIHCKRTLSASILIRWSETGVVSHSQVNVSCWNVKEKKQINTKKSQRGKNKIIKKWRVKPFGSIDALNRVELIMRPPILFKNVLLPRPCSLVCRASKRSQSGATRPY